MATMAWCEHCYCRRKLELNGGFFSCIACGKVVVDLFSENHENQLSDTSSFSEQSRSNEGYSTQIGIMLSQRKRGFDKANINEVRDERDSSTRSDSLRNLCSIMKKRQRQQRDSSSRSVSLENMGSMKNKRNLPSITCDHECFSSSYTKNENLTDALLLMVSKLVKASDLQQQKQVPNEELSSYEKCLLELQKLEGIKVSDFMKMVEVLKDEKNAVAFTTLKGSLRTAFIKSKCSLS